MGAAMNKSFGKELIGAMAPRLKAQAMPPAPLPLHIKLRLERLRLAELIRNPTEQDECGRRAPTIRSQASP